MAKAIILCGQPGSGKSTVAPLAAQLLSKSGSLFVSCDNEHFGVNAETRVAITTALGFENPDDPEFRRTIGLNILLDTMDSIASHLRGIAMSVPNVIGLIQLPDKKSGIANLV
jgi:energy-coupling factor transporter ATP-binding protein EcfA2